MDFPQPTQVYGLFPNPALQVLKALHSLLLLRHLLRHGQWQMSSAFSLALGSIITIFLWGILIYDFPMAAVTAADISDSGHVRDVTLNGFGTYRQFLRYALGTYSFIFAY